MLLQLCVVSHFCSSSLVSFFPSFVFLSSSFPFVSSLCFLSIWEGQHSGTVFLLLPVVTETQHVNQCTVLSIDLCPLLGVNDISGDIIIVDQYHACSQWIWLNLHLTLTIAETAPQFLLCFLGLGLLFSVFVYVCGSEISRALFCTSLNFNQVDLDSMHGEILNMYEDVCLFCWQW